LSDFTVDGATDEREGVLMEAIVQCKLKNVSAEPYSYNAAITLPNPLNPKWKQNVCVKGLEISRSSGPVPFDLQAAQDKFKASLQSKEDRARFEGRSIELQPSEE
jgi:hypothetical protein